MGPARGRPTERAAIDTLQEPLLSGQTRENADGATGSRQRNGRGLSQRRGNRDAQPDVAPLTAGHSLWSWCWFVWVTPLLRVGSSRQLQPDDLLRLDPSLQPDSCARELWLNWTKELLLRPERPSLLWALARTYGRPYAWLGLAKLLNDLLGFVGPLLLKELVGWLAVGHANDQPPTAASAPTVNSLGFAPPTAPTLPEALREWWRWLAAEWGPASPRFGLVCVAALAAASVARALLNSHFNYQLSRLSCQLRAGLMTALYRKSLLTLPHDTSGPISASSAPASTVPSARPRGRAVATGSQRPHPGRAPQAAAPQARGRVQAGGDGQDPDLELDPERGPGPSDEAAENGLQAPGPAAASAPAAHTHVSPGPAAPSASAAANYAASGEQPDAPTIPTPASASASASASAPAPASGSSPAAPGGREDVSTLMAVDTGRAVNLLLSFHEAWSLPWQIALALYMLYTQVRYAFVAGLIVSLLLVPINRLIAVYILAASSSMMAAKDSRVSLMSELLRGIRGAKLAPEWQDYYTARVAAARAKELRGLAVRKYLDALCVYFWAATGLLFSALTFGLVVLIGGGQALTPAVAFTSLSLFQLLIAPLNAFPWVINGCVEAIVSVRRLQAYLCRAETKALWAYGDLQLTLGQLPPESAANVIAAAAAAAAGDADGAAAVRSLGPGGALRCGLLAALAEAAADGGVGGAAKPLDRLLYDDVGPRQRRRLHGAARNSRRDHNSLDPCRTDVVSGSSAPPSVLEALAGSARAAAAAATAAAALAAASRPRPTPMGWTSGPNSEAQTPERGVSDTGGVAAPPPLFARLSAGLDLTAVGFVDEPGPGNNGAAPSPLGGAGGESAPAAVITDATFAWGRAASVRPCLSGVSLALPRGRLNVVVGRVGAGKSSLLAALLGGGELPLLAGSCRTHVRRLSYAPQQPWVTGGSLRDNVLLGAAMDQRLYDQVLEACALGPDLSAMPAGDLTSVGDHGCNLSGGQRARLGLARALYHAAAPPLLTPASSSVGPPPNGAPLPSPAAALALSPGSSRAHSLTQPQRSGFSASSAAWCGPSPPSDVLVLLDDVLASLDRSCAAHVVHHALLGPLLMPSPSGQPPVVASSSNSAGLSRAGSAAVGGGGYRPTVVVVSNDLRCIQAAAQVVVLEAGRLVFAGPPAAYFASPACLHKHLDGHSYDQDSTDGSKRPDKGQEEEGKEELGAGGKAPAKPATPGSSSADEEDAVAEPASARALDDPASPKPSAPRALNGDRPHSHDGGGSGGGTAGAEEVQEPEEERAVGHVRWAVYERYLSAVGWGLAVAVLLSLVAMQATKNGSDLWVSYFAAISRTADVGGGAAAGGAGPSYGAGGGIPWAAASRSAAVLAAMPHWCAAGGGGGISTAWPGPAAATAGFGPLPPWAAAAAAICPTAAAAAAAASTAAWPSWPSFASLQHLHQEEGRTQEAASVEAAIEPFSAPASTMARRALRARASLASLATGTDPAASLDAAYNPGADKGPDARGEKDEGVPGGAPSLGGSAADRFRSLSGPVRAFLVGLAAIALANMLATLARAFTFAFAGLRAAALLHERLLGAVLAAPAAFFDAVPSGRILNRFSSDVSAADDSLPFIANIALANAASLAGLLGVLCYAAPLLLPLLLPLAWAYRRLQLYYRGSSREIRRLEAAALSPVYGAFGSTAEAAPVIRAFGAQGHFLRQAISAVGAHQRAAITNGAASAWLGLRLQLMASGLVAAVAGIAVWRGRAAQNWSDAGSGYDCTHGFGDAAPPYSNDLVASLAGLSLAYALPVVGLLNGLLTSTAETEQEMVAVERLGQYIDMPSQPLTLPPAPPGSPLAAAEASASTAPPASPRPPVTTSTTSQPASPSPAVMFESVVLRYRPGLPPALAGLSLAVGGGQHVGLVGRTGAGKSSVVSALVRLTEVEAGRILLFGADVRSIPLRRLRSMVAVLPQTPFIASASVRDNLDPAAAAARARADLPPSSRGPCSTPSPSSAPAPLPDAALCAALRRVGLWDALASAARHRRSASTTSATSSAASALIASASTAEVLSLPLGSLPGAVGLSAGQRQLLALARLLLRPRGLVAADEVGAHVDPATAGTIRRVLAEVVLGRPGAGDAGGESGRVGAGAGKGEGGASAGGVVGVRKDAGEAGGGGWEFGWGGGCSLLEVAHDLGALDGADWVVVMEAGQAVEAGPPGELAERQGGRFRALCEASGAGGGNRR